MKVNTRQLLLLSLDEADFEGRLHFKKVSIFWNSDKGFKERWFKLKHNMLFYCKMGGPYPMLKEPSGVFILENYDVQYEGIGEVPFSFSIVFNYEPDIKYIFSARSDEVVHSWISVLRLSSFGHLKERMVELQSKIQNKTDEEEEQMTHKELRHKERVFNFSNLNVRLENLNINAESTENKKIEENGANKYGLNVNLVRKAENDSAESEVDLIVL